VAEVLAYLTMIAAGWLFNAWILMLTVGVVHGMWIPQLPTIGFPTALLLSSLNTARILAAAISTVVTKAIKGKSRDR
jgi:hypothetical protein